MIQNRTVSITGIFAADASTIIPENPVAGSSYRDTTMTGTVVREGWAFKTIVDSSKFNQAMYEYSSVTAQIEKYGFLPWSNLTDYVTGSVCLGSDGNLYQATQDTGPSSTAYDPTVNKVVWNPIILGATEFLFHHVWSEYILNRLDWLRADTFSWQNGAAYSNAYSHLLSDITGISPTTETVGSYTITYYQATDGHMICMADQETTIQDIYDETGAAWYYILDTTNTRFKLPRENPEVVKVTKLTEAPVAGNGKTVAWTNGSATGGTFADGGSGSRYGLMAKETGVGEPVSGSSSSGTYMAGRLGITTDPSISGIVAKLDQATQTRTYDGKKYLYFYVGQFSQTATEQTAGLNAELFNGKVDLNAQNLSDAGKSLIAGFGMPSNVYEDLTLGASGNRYTAPANGWFYVKKFAGATGKYISITNTTNAFATEAQPTASGNAANIFLPVKKGDVVEIGYNVTGNTDYFRFIYAVGSESEAS